MSANSIALVTGANKGIGLQIAADLVKQGFTVLVGARRLDAGQAAASSLGPAAHAIQLDVTDHASIAAAAERVGKEFGRLDVLVNNAGVAHAGQPGRSMEDMVQSGRVSTAPVDELQAVFATNVFGVVAVTQAMLPLLRQSPAARVVNLSSIAASLSLKSDPHNPMHAMTGIYAVSKTALNAVTQALAIELQGTDIKVNAVCPGFTATDMNNFAGTGSVEDAAREPVRLALLPADGPTGVFVSSEGALPW